MPSGEPEVPSTMETTIIARLAVLCVLTFLALAARAPAEGQRHYDPTSPELPADAVWLDSLDLTAMDQEWGAPHAGQSVDGRPIRLNGVTYPRGVGSHARSEMIVDLKGTAEEFAAVVGVDDEVGKAGSVVFEVIVDGKTAAKTKVLRGGDKPATLRVNLKGAKKMTLLLDPTEDGNGSDHADWAGAVIFLAPGAAEKPESFRAGAAPGMRIASGVSPKPSINGPRVVGATPGNPFLFLIPATGEGPLTYSAKNLPDGLTLDPSTGIITGSLKNDGTTVVELEVRGPRGKAKRELTIIGGKHKLAQTPPMGWNSWNVWAGSIDDKKVREAADWMVKSGLAAHGYQYINIDDCWSAPRDENGEIRCNEKFPDMKALADYVHSKGLKLGIYSSPGPTTCAGFPASWQHEEQDAKTWAKWGIDYLKYDWCSYGSVADNSDPDEYRKPYRRMRMALDKCGRDIVFSLCQYGMDNVWEWGAKVGGNCWRTTGDIGDTWSSMSSIGFSQAGHEKYAGPGHWNDPDMLVVGKVGWGPNLRPSRLTHNEQITHITLWSLLAAPLLIGCDLSDMDQFTIDLLSNDEVIAVNQDPLGRQAGRVSKDGMLEVWARPLFDGTKAVGLFNRGTESKKVTAKWSLLGLRGPQRVRDLWRKKNVGECNGSYTATVPPHGAVLVKIGG